MLIQSTALTAREQLPVEAFASLPAIEGIELSPSGEHLAMIVNRDGASYVAIQDLESKQITPIAKTLNDKYLLNWVQWANEQQLLTSVFFPDIRWRAQTGETRLLVFGPEDESPRLLVSPRGTFLKKEHNSQFQDRVVSLLPDDPQHILLALDLEKVARPAVYRVNLETGARSIVQDYKSHIRHWVADQQGNVRAASGYKSRDGIHSLWVKRTDQDEWHVVHEWKTLDESDITPLGFALDPRILYVRAKHNGRSAVFALDTDSPDFKRKLVAADPKHDIVGQLIYRNSKAIGVRHAFSPGRALFFDPENAQLQITIDNKIPDHVNEVVSEADQLSKFVLHSKKKDLPARFYLGEGSGAELTTISDLYPLLVGQNLSKKQLVAFEASDGSRIESFLSLPTGTSEEKYPAIIFSPGTNIYPEDRGFDYWTQFFTNRGYVVLQPIFPHAPGYWQEFRTNSITGSGLAVQQYFESAAQWIIDKGIAAKGRICVVGIGFGGYDALVTAAESPELFSCAISFAGVTDLEAMRSRARFYITREIVHQQLGEDIDSLEKKSPINLARKIQVPILLAHGEFDRVVPVEHGRQMAQALDHSNEDLEYLELEHGSHTLSIEENRILLFEAMDDFLAEHLSTNSKSDES
ncbi:MAG: prolyl oligopeptidase family serine peptidase [Pseudomonadota bacterium]